MNLPVFTETKTCIGGKLCFRCRDPGAEGEAWRTAMTRTHQVPDGWVCPPERGAKPMLSRGLGDAIAKVTRATGIAKIVHAVTKGNCRCSKRQASLNKRFPQPL